jgi:hypothetical protein
MNAVFLAFVALPAAFISFILEGRRKNNAPPNQLPFTWGYFVAMSSFLLGSYIMLFALYIAVAAKEDRIVGGVLLFLIGAIWAVPGYYAIKRRRWAWVVTTIVSCNPVWWIANTVYGSNRWNELEDGERLPISGPATI